MPMPRVLGGGWEEGHLLMGEVPLCTATVLGWMNVSLRDTPLASRPRLALGEQQMRGALVRHKTACFCPGVPRS